MMQWRREKRGGSKMGRNGERGKPAVQHRLNYSSTSEWVAAYEGKRGRDKEEGR